MSAVKYQSCFFMATYRLLYLSILAWRKVVLYFLTQNNYRENLASLSFNCKAFFNDFSKLQVVLCSKLCQNAWGICALFSEGLQTQEIILKVKMCTSHYVFINKWQNIFICVETRDPLLSSTCFKYWIGTTFANICTDQQN